MLKPIAVVIALLITLSSPLSTANEVNIYSARKEMLIKPLLDKFSEDTGIKVNLVTGKADALLSRLLSEGKLTPADIFLTTDAGRLYRAKNNGMFQAIESSYLNQHIPAHLRDVDSQWFGLSTRARPLMYSIERVNPDTLSTYEALAKPEFKGRVCIRSSSNIYNQSLVASMLASGNPEKITQFLKSFVKNFAQPPKGGDRDQIQAVANGICDVAIANTYYLAGMINGNNAQQQDAASKVKIFWPNQGGRGTHINISGAGIIKSSKNRDAALKLLEYLVSKEAQAWYSEVNFEYPVREGVAYSALLESWGTFQADQVNLSQLGEFNADAVKLMDQAGWR